MGKKTKVGKARKDKFYQLAKETGYRSRAAFKLIQLNRKFEFLQKSRVVVDLCAAPGGWAQVAAQNTPVSSVIVAIDLVPIRPIHNVTCLQEDITTDKCRQSLKKELQTWKADCFLNDGAPNVGQNWIYDAFQQAVLTLHAMKLATEFLRKGGWFITKVFRSKDYNALLWAFQQLFKHVHATKPQASRNESAEIFVVCQGFLAPDKIDPKFLDPKHVFKEVDPDTKAVPLNMVHPEKRRKQTEGYPAGDYTLYHTVTVTDFIHSDQFSDILSTTNAITLDDVRVVNHKLTTDEIQECCRDIKVLGKKELKSLLSWRKKMKQYLDELEGKVTEEEKEKTEEEGEEDEEALIEKQLAEAKETERRDLKRKLKKIRIEKNKLRHKMDMKMVIPGDVHDFSDDVGLFHLEKLKSKKHLEQMEVEEFSLDEDDGEESGEEGPSRRQVMTFDRDTKDYLESDLSDEEEVLEGKELESESDREVETAGSNPLVVSLDDVASQRSREVDSWFGKDVFAGLESKDDEYEEIEKMTQEYKKKGGIVIENKKLTKKGKDKVTVVQKTPKKTPETPIEQETGSESDSGNASDSDSGSESDPTSDSDSDESLTEAATHTGPVRKRKKLNNSNKDGFEVIPQNLAGIEPRLDAVGLAIGAAIATSQKRKRDIIDQAYNRYSFEDVNLPDWFAADERKHHRRPLPVTKEEVIQYKQREKEINARPIKKIAEAKARKKRKMMKKLEKARRKSEAICDSIDVSEKEKWSQIKHIYNKAGLLKNKKKELTYVVAKKGMGKRVRRPAGVQGQFKVVDPRMKKDMRKVNAREKRTGRGRKGKSGKKR